MSALAESIAATLGQHEVCSITLGGGATFCDGSGLPVDVAVQSWAELRRYHVAAIIAADFEQRLNAERMRHGHASTTRTEGV